MTGGRGPRGLLPREEEEFLSKCFFPAAARRGAGIFGGAILKEIRVLHAIKHIIHPREWIAPDVINGVQTELPKSSVRNVPDVFFNIFGFQSLDATHLKGEFDERILMVDDGRGGDIKVLL